MFCFFSIIIISSILSLFEKRLQCLAWCERENAMKCSKPGAEFFWSSCFEIKKLILFKLRNILTACCNMFRLHKLLWGTASSGVDFWAGRGCGAGQQQWSEIGKLAVTFDANLMPTGVSVVETSLASKRSVLVVTYAITVITNLLNADRSEIESRLLSRIEFMLALE